MTEIFSSSFMQKALLVGVVVSLAAGYISAFVVLRKMSFIGAGISHASFGGVAIGFFSGINPMLAAVFYAMAVALGIEFVTRKGKISEDTSIGIFFASSMALGIVLIGLSQEYTVDLFGYLFGNILAISDTEVSLSLGTGLLVVILLTLFLKELLMIAYSEDLARVSGIRVKFFNTLFLLLLALSIVISMKVVGIILISALLVIPGATAQLFARNVFSMIAFSCLVAVASMLIGLVVAYEFDVPPGGTIVLTATLLFAVALLLKRRK
jgi:ABC-type Mn2+/Zn2+ transport system permease subunit